MNIHYKVTLDFFRGKVIHKNPFLLNEYSLNRKIKPIVVAE